MYTCAPHVHTLYMYVFVCAHMHMFVYVVHVLFEYVCGVCMEGGVLCVCMCAPVLCACECGGKGGNWLIKPRTVCSVLNPLFSLCTCTFSNGSLVWHTLTGERGSTTPDYK